MTQNKILNYLAAGAIGLAAGFLPGYFAGVEEGMRVCRRDHPELYQSGRRRGRVEGIHESADFVEGRLLSPGFLVREFREDGEPSTRVMDKYGHFCDFHLGGDLTVRYGDIQCIYTPHMRSCSALGPSAILPSDPLDERINPPNPPFDPSTGPPSNSPRGPMYY
ncbi:hypothetical protein ACFL0V_02250 [Nanoarchaeota archaeon]